MMKYRPQRWPAVLSKVRPRLFITLCLEYQLETHTVSKTISHTGPSPNEFKTTHTYICKNCNKIKECKFVQKGCSEK